MFRRKYLRKVDELPSRDTKLDKLLTHITRVFGSRDESGFCAASSFPFASPQHVELSGEIIFWEAPIGVVVWWGMSPAFCLGVEFTTTSIRVRQMHVARDFRVPPELRDWALLLLIACQRTAKECGLSGVRIFPMVHLRSHVTFAFEKGSLFLST